MATSGTQTDNTFVEQLHKLLGQITSLKTANDADLPFAINLETMILQRLKGGADQAMNPQGQGQPGMPGAGGPPGMPMPGGMPPGMPVGLMGSPAPPPGQGSPAMVPGLQQGPAPMNADELRRMLKTDITASRLGSVSSRLANSNM